MFRLSRQRRFNRVRQESSHRSNTVQRVATRTAATAAARTVARTSAAAAAEVALDVVAAVSDSQVRRPATRTGAGGTDPGSSEYLSRRIRARRMTSSSSWRAHAQYVTLRQICVVTVGQKQRPYT